MVSSAIKHHVFRSSYPFILWGMGNISQMSSSCNTMEHLWYVANKTSNDTIIVLSSSSVLPQWQKIMLVFERTEHPIILASKLTTVNICTRFCQYFWTSFSTRLQVHLLVALYNMKFISSSCFYTNTYK